MRFLIGVIMMVVVLNYPEISSARPAEKTKLAVMIQSVATLADRGHFEALEKLFAEEVEVDYTSAFGGEVELKSRQALMTQWANSLPGFDATRHSLSNIKIAATVKDGTAKGTADVVADHYLDDQVWRITGSYEYRFALNADKWEITHMTFNAGPETGSRDLLDKAVQRASRNPSGYIVRQRTMQAVRDFLEALEAKDMKKFANVWAEDAVQDMPYSPEGFPKRINGRENIIRHYAEWPENSGKADFTSQLVFYPMKDPQMVFAEWKGKVDIIPTGRKYHQTYGGLFHVENGKILLFREYFDPAPFAYAFGLNEG